MAQSTSNNFWGISPLVIPCYVFVEFVVLNGNLCLYLLNCHLFPNHLFAKVILIPFTYALAPYLHLGSACVFNTSLSHPQAVMKIPYCYVQDQCLRSLAGIFSHISFCTPEDNVFQSLFTEMSCAKGIETRIIFHYICCFSSAHWAVVTLKKEETVSSSTMSSSQHEFVKNKSPPYCQAPKNHLLVPLKGDWS